MPTQTLKSFFGTLASSTRLSIIFSLASGEKTVNQLMNGLDLEQSIVSHGLRRLLAHDFIRIRRKGRARHYRLNHERTKHVFALANSIGIKESGGGGQAGAEHPGYVMIVNKNL